MSEMRKVTRGLRDHQPYLHCSTRYCLVGGP
nr:MAG TPA: hypothetical protein [Caudoviricetes sp.]DAU58296.1 MAG TPA: hypothetical protein [Caudoviricetes sp.]